VNADVVRSGPHSRLQSIWRPPSTGAFQFFRGQETEVVPSTDLNSRKAVPDSTASLR
jgi:hypothetical protein